MRKKISTYHTVLSILEIPILVTGPLPLCNERCNASLFLSELFTLQTLTSPSSPPDIILLPYDTTDMQLTLPSWHLHLSSSET